METLSLNIPTIVFNSKDNSYLIRDDAKEHYENLKKAKIFFDDEKQLANHINNVWNDVDSWWKSHDVQKIAKIFFFLKSLKGHRKFFLGASFLDEVKKRPFFVIFSKF